MKVPLSWLREFVAVELPLPDLAQRLTMAGLEVESIEVLGADWRDVAIARVTDVERHPRADTLHVARLDRGGREVTVVTAAQNLQVGALVPHVGPGGRLPAGEIGTRAFQGITSEGMLCSGSELAIAPDRDGIYELEASAPVGQQLAEYLAEAVLEFYITPNRPDCMGVVGIAREVHALTGARLLLPTFVPPRGDVPADQLVRVRVDDPSGCPRFVATVLRGVTIGPSPHWLQRRLHLAGVRTISNAVDVTNYVMFELGQPLHGFDGDLLAGDPPTLVARQARLGEHLRTLDGLERGLPPGTLVVADEHRVRSVAGIMGGADSEISATTRNVILEGANWNRAMIRRASTSLGLSSEAARRFGRGMDPELASLAVARAAALMAELTGGETADGLVDAYPGRAEAAMVAVRPEQIDALLGTSYPREGMVAALAGLGFTVHGAAADRTWNVRVPSHRRFDVAHRADIAEEVARVLGYEQVPATLPAGSVPDPRRDGDAGYSDEVRARQALAAAGLQEVITYSLLDPEQPAKLDSHAAWPPPPDRPPESAVRVVNPMSAEHSILRPTLFPGLLDALRTNLRHRERALLFELGRVWPGPLDPNPGGASPLERRHIGAVLRGPRGAKHWGSTESDLDFFDLKGIVDYLAKVFRLTPAYEPIAHAALHPGRAARVLVQGHEIGVLGQLHPRVAERFDLPGAPTLVAELDFEALLGGAATTPNTRVMAPPRFPHARRDIAVVVAETVRHDELTRVIRSAGGPLLADIQLFDLYRGEQVSDGYKSLAFALTYQASDRTLGDDETSAAHAQVEQALRERFRAEIRGRA